MTQPSRPASTRAPRAKPRHRHRPLRVEPLEDRRLLAFGGFLGQLQCEAVAENGRLIYQAAAQRTKDLSPAGETLPQVYRDAVREALEDAYPNISDTLSRIRVHWNATLTDTDVLGGIDIGSADGQTFGYEIYLKDARPEVAYNRDLRDLILHEIGHTLQYERFGSSLSNFGYHYFKGWCQAGFNYSGNYLEQEASDLESDYKASVNDGLWPTPVTVDVWGVSGSQSDSSTQEVGWQVTVGRVETVTAQLYKKQNGVWKEIRDFSKTDSDVNNGTIPTFAGSFNFDSEGVGDYRLKVSRTERQPKSSGTGSSRVTIVDIHEFDVDDDDDSAATAPYASLRWSHDGSPFFSRQVPSVYDSASPTILTWAVSDRSGIYSANVTVTETERGLGNVGGAAYGAADRHEGSLDITTLGAGTYVVTVSATDNDNDWPGDRTFTPQVGSRTFRLIDDDPDPPRIDFATTAGQPLLGDRYSESHGEDNHVHWNVSDTSGVSQATARLWRGNELLDTRQVSAADRWELDAYGLGTFRVELTAVDADTDGWAEDQSESTSNAYLTVTNEPPTVFAGGPYLLEEGRLLTLRGVGSDPDRGDTEQLVYAWDLDHDGQFDDASGAQPVVNWDQWLAAGVADDGTYTIRVQVTDTFGATATATGSVTVLNGAPQIESIHSQPDIDENSELTVTGRFSDPSPLDTHEVLVFWGDGTSSPAMINTTERTFTATHYYADDRPSETPVDEYVLSVQLTDDDGAVNPPTSRALTVVTNRGGAIELPEFHSSLPAGTSGRLQSAHVQVIPGAVETSAEAAQFLNHRHSIDYPNVGPFDLPLTWTSEVSAGANHDHAFDIGPQTVRFSGPSLSSYFQQPSEVVYTMSPRETDDSTNLPVEYDHDHQVSNVQYSTTTTFTYWRNTVADSSVSILNSSAESGESNWITHRGSPDTARYGSEDSRGYYFPSKPTSGVGSYFFYGGFVEFSRLYQERPIPSSMWLPVDEGRARANLSAFMGGWEDQQDYSRIELVWFNGSHQVIGTSSLTGPSRSARGNDTKLMLRSLNAGIPAGARSVEINLEFYRVGTSAGTRNDGYIDAVNLYITDQGPTSSTTATEYRNTTDAYALPKFNASLGTLVEAQVTLDPQPARTSFKDVTGVMHSHELGLSLPPFVFDQVVTSEAAATQAHDHQVQFQKVERDFVDELELRELFLQEEAVLLLQPAVGSSSTFGHDHDIAEKSIPFRTETTFTYDVTSLVVRVHNTAPSSLAVTLPDVAYEDSTVPLTGTFADFGSSDTHRAIIDWGDGSSDELPVPPGQYSFAASHQYLDDSPTGTPSDSYTVTVTVLDDDGESATISRTITLLNELPQLALALSSAVEEGAIFSLPTAAFTDRGRLDTHTAQINWGDNQTAPGDIIQTPGAGNVLGQHVYRDEGDYTVQVTVTDDDGGSAVKSIVVPVLNVAPAIDRLWTEGPAIEGAGLSLRSTVTDPGDDILTYMWDFGDDSAPVSGVDLATVSHAFAAEGTYTITLLVDDGDGGAVSQTLTVVVADLSTAASISGSSLAIEGSAYTLTLSAFTAEAAAAISTWIVDWGDDSTSFSSTDGSLSHTYLDGPADHTVRVHVENAAGGTATIGSLPVHVVNAAPRITSLDGDRTGNEGQTLHFAAEATDPGTDTLTYHWDFGDGATRSGVDLREVDHAYADDGSYLVALTVADEEGTTDVRHFAVLVANDVPSIGLSGAAEAVEGAAYTLLLGAITDDGDDTVTAWTVDWGDGRSSTYESGGAVVHAYADGPASHVIRVSLTDEDGIHRHVGQHPVSVTNAAPAIASLVADTPKLEGQVVTFSADVTDPASLYDLLTYEWDFGDGSPSVSGINLASARHTYADNGDYPVTLTVTDEDGGSTTLTLDVSVGNVAPVTVLSGGPQAIEGQAYTLSFGPIFDPGPDTVTQWIVNWGDGSQDTLDNSDDTVHVYSDGLQAYEIKLSVVDEDGTHADVASLPVSVRNTPPTLTELTGQTAGSEGSSFAFHALGLDVASDVLTYSWDFGDGTSVVSDLDLRDVAHTYADHGVYLLTVTVDDGDGGADSASLLVEVSNVVPTIALTGAATTNEGATYELTLGAVDDPGDDTVSQYVVDWGDGSNSTYAVGGVVTHTYVDGDANHAIRVTLIDEDGFYADVGSQEVVVANLPPTISQVDAPENPREGQALSFAAQASDPAGAADTLTYTWDFGDGSDAVSGVGLKAPQHTYADQGQYTVRLTVTDEDGGQDTAEFELSVVNVAPTIETAGAPSVEEVAAYTLTLGTIYDPGADAVTQWIVSWGDGSHDTYSSGGQVTHVYADGPATAMIAVSLIDEDGTHLAAQRAVTVRNVAPVISYSTEQAEGDESGTLNFTAAASDVAGAADPLTYTWDFGDGSDPVSGVDLTNVSHTFWDDGDYSVRLTVSDSDGGSTSEFIAVRVYNVAPMFDAASKNASFDVVENSGQGTQVGSVGATDPGHDTLTFAISGGTGATAFAIDEATGQITVADPLQLDYETTTSFTLELTVADDEGATDTALVTIQLLNQASLTGTVFVDTDQNGLYAANEMGIDFVMLELLDLDGNVVATAQTSDGGFYLFEDVDPGTYWLREVQPTGVTDGADQVGTLGGTQVANDTIQLTLERTDAHDYIFAEIGQQVGRGDAAGIGFWQNKHGQQLIAQGGTALASWLTSTFSNVFGNQLSLADGNAVAEFYREQLFRQKGRKVDGPAKVDAQFMGVALALYFTNRHLAGDVATAFGFNVTDTGIGTRIVNVGDRGAAFATENNSQRTILQLLLATNALTDTPDNIAGFSSIYDADGDGVIDSEEARLRRMANELFALINDAGGI